MSRYCLCDICKYPEFIGSPNKVKCYGMSGAIRDMKILVYDSDSAEIDCEDVKKICLEFEQEVKD